MDADTLRSQNMAARLSTALSALFELFVLLVQLVSEFFISAVKAVIGAELRDVSGEVVLITGTGHGIGREVALQYTRLGCRVICVDINQKANEETVAECNRLEVGNAFAYCCDVSIREKVLELAEKVKKDVGLVSVLINNVGIMPTHPLDKHTPDEIRKTFDINVFSHFWTIEAFLPQMKEQHRGHIVAISSIAGVVGLSNIVPYCATKFAVRGMMEALSEELREGPFKDLIRTTVICPYMTNTGLCKKPIVKFPTILGLLEPKQVATEIVKAQRTNVHEMTIPRGLLPFNNFCRVIPLSCALMLKDFIGSGVESDL